MHHLGHHENEYELSLQFGVLVMRFLRGTDKPLELS
jgi:hypothetical protein